MTGTRSPNPTLSKLETVFAACDQLERQQPGRWGQNDLHRLVGGSLETLVPLRQLWTRQQALRERAPATASTVLLAMATAVDRAMGEFRVGLEAAVAELAADRDGMVDNALAESDSLKVQLNDITATRDAVQQEANDLQAQLAELHRDADTLRDALRAAHATLAEKMKERDQLDTQIQHQAEQLASLTTQLESRNQNLADHQSQLATLRIQIEAMTVSHEQALSHLNQRHASAIDALARDHRVDLLETRQAERDAGQQIHTQAVAAHQAELARQSDERTASESGLRQTATDAQQQAALAEGQVALLSRQLENLQRRLDEQRTGASRAQQELTAVIAFAMACETAEVARQFLGLWETGDVKAIIREFPAFRPPNWPTLSLSAPQ